MKIVCTDKISGKRVLVSDVECPNYKDEYNNECGKPFVIEAPEVIEVKPKKVARKRKTTKKSK